MNAMHYAVYFDAAETVRVLAEQNPSLVMSTCSELSNGSCLHLAAAHLSLEAGKVLVSRNMRLCVCVCGSFSMEQMDLQKMVMARCLMKSSQTVSTV